MHDSLTVVHINDIASVATTIAAEQQRRGLTVRVEELPKPGAAWPWPWKLALVPLRILLASTTAAGIRRERPDLVHVHYATQGFVGPMAGRPYVLHCHGTDVRGVAPGSPRGRYLGVVMRRAALVLVSTPDLLDDAARLVADPVYLPNPIDTSLFTPTGGAVADVLLAVRLDAVKGGDIAIGALAHLLELRPVTTATVIAAGAQLDLARATFGSRVRFIDPVPHEAVPAVIGRHRAVIGQFRLGSLGQLELESMAMGVPVVTNVRHVAPGSEPPPVVQGATATAAAVALAALLEDDAGRIRLGALGRAWVARHHAVAAVVDRLAGLYEHALAPSAAHGREQST